jgi:hypothetical protein
MNQLLGIIIYIIAIILLTWFAIHRIRKQSREDREIPNLPKEKKIKVKKITPELIEAIKVENNQQKPCGNSPNQKQDCPEETNADKIQDAIIIEEVK